MRHIKASLIEAIAQRISNEIQPETVLDVGCGSGQLVKYLRQLGLQAWGIDDPQMPDQAFAAESCLYCSRAQLTTPFLQSYDLITCLESILDYPADEAEAIIANLCKYTDQILFSANPYPEKTDQGDNKVQASSALTPDYWVEIFSRFGFYHDLGFKLHPHLPWAMKLSRRDLKQAEIASYYERWLQYERQEKERHMLEKAQALLENDQMLRDKDSLYQEHMALLNSNSWRFMQFVHRIRYRLVPLGSARERWMHNLLARLRPTGENDLHQASSRPTGILEIKDPPARASTREEQSILIKIKPVLTPADVQPHNRSVDVIICIHNALPDVKKCLESVQKHTTSPYFLILVDDGSDPETTQFLSEFSERSQAILIRNQQPLGYTRAANQGLKHSSGDFTLLLNSDTIVSSQWLDRLVACAESDTMIGIVGPLSNTASWQSIPEIEANGDWAANPLPSGISIDEMAGMAAKYSGRLYPPMPFINGFCMMMRREVIEQVGIFDEERFGEGYGEENDLCLRARKAGWKLALADDVYVYHAQSKSYSDEKRKRLSESASGILAQKYSKEAIEAGVRYCREDQVLKGIRARSRQWPNRREIINSGRERYQGKRLLFVLPVPHAGGGSNVVITEARAMQAMGMHVGVFNLKTYEETFRISYPDLAIPVIYGEISDLPGVAMQFDAVVATYNPSIAWLAPVRQLKLDLVVGYYAQDYEPMLFPDEPKKALRAKDSYTLIPGTKLFSKTQWTREQINANTQANCTVVGPSIDSELFRPRPRKEHDNPQNPVRIGAMIRSDSPYRAPRLTMEVLRKVSRSYGIQVEIQIFGMEINELKKAKLPLDFAWKSAGVLTTQQVANYMNGLDIFADFSSHQAMGLTALEAMACGLAVIVPQNGGATEFAEHERNSLVVDTSSSDKCLQALIRLIEEPGLRAKLQDNAIYDVSQYHPEGPAFRILSTLFG